MLFLYLPDCQSLVVPVSKDVSQSVGLSLADHTLTAPVKLLRRRRRMGRYADSAKFPGQDRLELPSIEQEE